MYSMMHPHPLEVPATPTPVKRGFLANSEAMTRLEIRHTRGGIERAMVAIRALRTMAARARKGTPWAECASGEPEAALKEVKLRVQVKESCTGAPAEAQREWYDARLWSECHNVAVGFPRRAYAVPYYAGKLGGDPRRAVAVVRRRHPEERFTR